MARNHTIQVEGTVVDCLPNTTFQVKLRNGHTVLGHVAREDRSLSIHVLRDDKVMLEMTPYDMSKGRIICRQT